MIHHAPHSHHSSLPPRPPLCFYLLLCALCCILSVFLVLESSGAHQWVTRHDQRAMKGFTTNGEALLQHLQSQQPHASAATSPLLTRSSSSYHPLCSSSCPSVLNSSAVSSAAATSRYRASVRAHTSHDGSGVMITVEDTCCCCAAPLTFFHIMISGASVSSYEPTLFLGPNTHAFPHTPPIITTFRESDQHAQYSWKYESHSRSNHVVYSSSVFIPLDVGMYHVNVSVDWQTRDWRTLMSLARPVNLLDIQLAHSRVSITPAASALRHHEFELQGYNVACGAWPSLDSLAVVGEDAQYRQTWSRRNGRFVIASTSTAMPSFHTPHHDMLYQVDPSVFPASFVLQHGVWTPWTCVLSPLALTLPRTPLPAAATHDHASINSRPASMHRATWLHFIGDDVSRQLFLFTCRLYGARPHHISLGRRGGKCIGVTTRFIGTFKRWHVSIQSAAATESPSQVQLAKAFPHDEKFAFSHLCHSTKNHLKHLSFHSANFSSLFPSFCTPTPPFDPPPHPTLTLLLLSPHRLVYRPPLDESAWWFALKHTLNATYMKTHVTAIALLPAIVQLPG